MTISGRRARGQRQKRRGMGRIETHPARTNPARPSSRPPAKGQSGDDASPRPRRASAWNPPRWGDPGPNFEHAFRRGGESNPRLWRPTLVASVGVEPTTSRLTVYGSTTELRRMADMEGIEPPTGGLRLRCSTAELHVHTVLSSASLVYGGGRAIRTGRGATSLR